MKEPYVRIELVDGTNTWITVCPVELNWAKDQEHYGAEEAAAVAFGGFLRNLILDQKAVSRHLRKFKVEIE